MSWVEDGANQELVGTMGESAGELAVVCVGASAGGVEALSALAEGLDPDIPAAILVALHVREGEESRLPHILDRESRLPAAHARDLEAIEPGRIYVAPPDRHLIVWDSTLRLVRGPRENLHRPSIDVLFRSAAVAFGPRAIGVVLTGTRDDGAAGLQAIRACGGQAVVQDPDEAPYSGMPESAIARDNPQHVVDLVEMPALLERLSRQSGEDQPMSAAEELLSEVKIAALAPDSGSPLGPATGFSCPECNGVLFELEGENRFRCRIGHAYSLQSLVTDQARSLEDALWTALRALEEQAALSKRVASRFSDYSKLHADFERRARRASEDASLIRELLGAGSGEA